MKVTPRQKTHTAVMKQWINFKFHFFFFFFLTNAAHIQHIWMCLSMARSCRGQCGLFNPTLLHLIANGSIPSLYLWLHRQGQGSIRSNPGDTLNDWISYKFTARPTETSGFHQLSDWHIRASVDPSTAQGRHTHKEILLPKWKWLDGEDYHQTGVSVSLGPALLCM